jgi:t-SNARE complex subunit (syntaxin)
MNIPDEYLNSDFDFGFTAVDADDLGVSSPESTESSSNAIDSAVLEKIEDRLNLILASMPGDEIYNSGVERIEQKVDNILSLQNDELSKTIESQGENIRAVIDEVEERKEQLEEAYKSKMTEVEKLVLPLLYNLMKNPARSKNTE